MSIKYNGRSSNIENHCKLFFLFSLVSIMTIIPFESFANNIGNDAISQTLCNIIIKLTGPIGKGIATIAIVVLGIGLFLGKLSWAVAVATAIGIGLIFGAVNVVDWIGSGITTIGTGTESILIC